MKQIVCIIVCVLAFFTVYEVKAQEATCVANKNSAEIVMNIPMKIKPEYVEIFKTAFEKCRTETLKEEACLAYDLFQSYKDSTEFHLFERWAHKPGHLAHMETEHIKVYFKEIEGARDRAAGSMLEVYVCPIMNAK
jgi:quinol monooxygenase YgiN